MTALRRLHPTAASTSTTKAKAIIRRRASARLAATSSPGAFNRT